jgi:zinc-ribbon domain
MCPNCQAPARADADFCTNCGTSLRGPAVAGAAPVTEPAPGRVPYPQAAPDQPQQGQPGWNQPATGWPPQRSSAPPFRFDLKRLAPADMAVGGASMVVFLSLFLPWFGVLGFTTSGISLHGYLAIAMLTSLALVGYLAVRAGWENMPVRLPIAHTPLLLIGTGVQLLFVLIGFLQSDGLSREFGAYLGLLAALTACGAIAVLMIIAARGDLQRGSS